jgi:phosphoglycerol transferase
MKTIKATFGKQWQLKLASLLAVLAGTSAWVFNQVKDINPAILQDEWVYLVTSRLYSPWAQDLPFDFGNYLYNLVYSSTNLCGEAFYTCAKALNIAFIQGFALTLFVIALRFLPFWGALVFYAAVALSPTSVYASMLLPEPMFFFFIALTLLAITRASKNQSWQDWVVVGVPLAFAALVKPHALFAAMAIGIYLLVAGLEKRPYWRPTLLNAAALLGSFLAVRFIVGFVAAGPKALNIFSAYGASGAVGEFVGGVASGKAGSEASTLIGSGNVAGAVGLFPAQFMTHAMVVAALLGASVVAVLIAVIHAVSTKQVRAVHKFSVLTLVWLLLMMVAIVLFTGWITGGGDDHTTRVLLRYYDYLFPIVALAGVAVAADKEILTATKAWVRWLIVGPVFLLISIAFAGYFGTLTIQIADAPNLAGLVVDKLTFDTTGNLTMLVLLLIAFFPRFAIWGFAAMVPFTLVMTGYQIQDQYQGFRLEDSAADKAGHFTAETLDVQQRDDLLILAETRFDARVASFWLEHNTDIELLGAESVYPVANLPEGTKWVLAIGNLSMESGDVVSTEDGYKLYKIQD